MRDLKRVFILGGGFSYPAGMPLAIRLLPLLVGKLQLEEMRQWTDGLCERLAWLSGNDRQAHSFDLNIEEVSHYEHLDVEAFRLRDHLATVGLGEGEHWCGDD